jgi:uncharacterized membrane protein YozB (DUF420 family)
MIVSGQATPFEPRARSTPIHGRQVLTDHFHALMSLLIAAVMMYGFGNGIDARLPRAPSPPPAIVYLHAIVFSAFVALFVVQSALIRTRNVRWHRRLGVLGVLMGAALPFLGMATVLSGLKRSGGAASLAFLVFQLNDLVSFSIAFGLAVWWRRKPELHRRLMLMAVCILTAAAFGRFPAGLLPANPLWFYAGVDLLILLGVTRDLLAAGRVHLVYVIGLPAAVAAQLGAMAIFLTAPPVWMAMARGLT